MFETPITVIGRIVTDPRRRAVGEQDVVKFRMASNTRRRTDDGNWEPGDSLFVNVNCWGRLVTGVAASLKKGDAVIVAGNIHTSEYDDREGVRRSSLEVRATAVGPDLGRYIARLEKHGQPVAIASGGDTDETDDASGGDADGNADGMALSA
jgi:single-strand DNA-binding protein